MTGAFSCDQGSRPKAGAPCAEYAYYFGAYHFEKPHPILPLVIN